MLQVKALVLQLAAYEIQYVLLGTLGAIAYGARLTTQDMDVCFAPDAVNLQRMSSLLQVLAGKPQYTPPYNTQEDCDGWQPYPLTVENFDHLFTTSLGLLDFVPAPFGSQGKLNRFDYADLNSRAVTLYPYNIPVRLAHPDDLIASKLSAKRPKDYAVSAELERVQAAHRAGAHTCRGWTGLRCFNLR